MQTFELSRDAVAFHAGQDAALKRLLQEESVKPVADMDLVRRLTALRQEVNRQLTDVVLDALAGKVDLRLIRNAMLDAKSDGDRVLVRCELELHGDGNT